MGIRVRFVKKKDNLFPRLRGVALEGQEIRYPDPRLREAQNVLVRLRSARLQLERAIDYFADAIAESALAWDEEEFKKDIKIALVDIRQSRLNLEEAERKLRELAGL